MHNTTVELQGKCRKLTYMKIDRPITDENGAVTGTMKAGTVFSIFSGGGALEELTGDDLLIAKYHKPEWGPTPSWLGCIEMFYNQQGMPEPLMVDLAAVDECHKCVETVWEAQATRNNYIWEQGLLASGSIRTEKQLREILAQAKFLEQDATKKAHFEAVLTELDACCLTCDTALDALLTSRDVMITFKTDDERDAEAQASRDAALAGS